MGKKKRRNWSDDEKRMICAQSRVLGVSVSQVARRYDVNANLVFTWLRDDRFSLEGDTQEQAQFLPVEIVEMPERRAELDSPSTGTINIEIAGGHRLCVNGAYDPEALARLIKGLSA